MKEIRYLILKEISLEWKTKYAFNGLLLYVVSTIFVCFLSFKQIIDPPTWNALFWIIMLFASVNAVAKSFMTETRGRLLYYYTLTSAEAVIISKTIYMERLDGDIPVEVAMVYNDSFNENIHSYVNNINTHEGGTHLQGFRMGLTRTLK